MTPIKFDKVHLTGLYELGETPWCSETIFRKDMYSGVHTNFVNFVPLEYKFGFVHSLLNWCFHLSSDFLKFRYDFDQT